MDYEDDSLTGCNDLLTRSRIVGLFFNPSIVESFVHAELTNDFHEMIPERNCKSWRDCKQVANGYCMKGKCVKSNAFYHDAYDLGLLRMMSYCIMI